MKIPFNKLYLTGKEFEYIKEAIKKGEIAGDGVFTLKCQQLIEKKSKIKKVFLTPSCTQALELAYLLINPQSGAEVIVPSFTFSSTVNAFLLWGAKPIFVDIRPDTLNIDEKQIFSKITPKTKVICPVHYAGVACEMDFIMKIARDRKIFVVEDAAGGVNAKYKNQYLGTIGDFGAYSFHLSKGYTCGEGGALLVNSKKFIKRAEIVREMGTSRGEFRKGELDNYSWLDIGSSYLLSDILAAFLYAQLEKLDEIKQKRKRIFEYYQKNLRVLENRELIRLPHWPSFIEPNYNIFYLIVASVRLRNKIIKKLKEKGIETTFHYLPLHLSKMGRKFGYKWGDLPKTENLSERLLRLPLYPALTRKKQDYVLEKLFKIMKEI